MKQLPLITVIVPVYQVKAYIKECLDSLIIQTYTNLEILLVDDGSTDGSGMVCDEYVAKDARMRVIHQENQGPSAARNAGMDHAKGEYVAFVDSDDVVVPDFIETLYVLLDKYQADISACIFKKCRTDELETIRDTGINRKILTGRNRREICMSSEQMLRQWHGKYKRWETVVWNKLYRKNILNGGNGAAAVYFPTGRKLEDVLTSHRMIANATLIVMTTQELYLYRIRPDSRAYQSRMGRQIEENLRAQRERMAFFKEKRYWRAYLNLLVGYVLHWGWFGWRQISTNKVW